jgi:hypothetical protein
MQSMTGFWLNFALVLTGLLLFGSGYNALTGWLEKRDHLRGFVSLAVAVGTGITILASAFLIGLVPALIVLACFGASGLPMILGSVGRYINARAADEKAARELAQETLHVNPPAGDR